MSDIIGQMMMQMYPKFETFDWAKTQQDALTYRTRLLEFQDLKRQQETAARTRQFLQEHPELVLGPGGGSTIGSLLTAPGGPGGPPGAAPMTQQQVMPGQPPGAPQMVPGGQDLSQFATQGGPPQSTIASLAPQPQGQMQALQNRFLLDLARTSPDAAMQVQQLMQGQQDLALKRDEQRLLMGTKVAEYVGRVAQSVTSPETLEQARQELARVHPQAAAQLPQTYSKEAMLPFVKKALSVKDSATLQLETWKNQIEEQKLGIQLANAGYQGLGTDVTSILRGLTPEQVQQFGGRTTPSAIAYATEEEKKRKLGQAGEAERLKFELEEKQRSTLPLQDARKEDAGLFVYKGTGQTVPGTLPYGQTKQLQDEKDPEKGVVKLANLDEKKQLTTLKQLEPVLQQYADLVQYAYGANGPLENYTRSPGSVLSAAAGQAIQNDPTFAAKRRALQGQLQSVVRGLGARGDLNAQELDAAKEMIANMDASMGLGLSLGPILTTSGPGASASIKPTFSIPDTPETGINLANELIGTVNRRIGSILQHDGYSKTPFITLRTNQQGQPQPGVMPQAMPGSQAPPLSSTVPPRTWGIAPPGPQPGPGTPAPLPPAPAAPTTSTAPAPAPAMPATTPGTRPAPPTATSTLAQDEAYRRSLAPPPAPTPAPSAPAPRPTPGRQSQAPTGTRLAGGPKFMELADVAEAMRQTGRSRREVEAAARSKGYTVYGSKLPLPEVTMVG